MTSRISDKPINEERRPLDDLLNTLFDRLSQRIAGGRRHPNDLLPESQDPMEGIIPDEFRPDLQMADWFDPTVWAQASPNDVDGINMTGIQPATGEGREGKGLDWFRGGEAPNNYANRHNPLYKARREFAIQIAPKIEEMFNVSAQGSAGYMRPPSAGDKKPGGRSANSDHYSGGAIDFFGSKEDMIALRNWATTQPWCSFIRCQSESHYDHVHLSIDVGWIAQNYFQGGEIPSLSAATSGGERRASSSPAPDLPRTSTKPSTAVPPVVERGAPS